MRPSWRQVVCSSETHGVALAGPRRASSDNVTGQWFGLFSGFLQTACPVLPAWLFGRNLGVLCCVLGKAWTVGLGGAFRCCGVNRPYG